MFFILFVMLFSNVGISVYVALPSIFHFYFEKENQLQYILKVFFEGPMSVFFAVCFFSERGPGSSGLSKTCFGVIAENLFFAKLFARPRQRCHAGQYCGGRTS